MFAYIIHRDIVKGRKMEDISSRIFQHEFETRRIQFYIQADMYKESVEREEHT
jgi:hypothetical protein